MSKTCQLTVLIKEGRPGTAPTIYDPGNELNGAKYEPCGKPGVEKNIIWRCEEHAKKYRARQRNHRKNYVAYD